jgi:hypothetical protein
MTMMQQRRKKAERATDRIDQSIINQSIPVHLLKYPSDNYFPLSIEDLSLDNS